jgi:hypothetical protein
MRNAENSIGKYIVDADWQAAHSRKDEYMETISIKELKDIKEEGLILRGCGGDLGEWVRGINDILTEKNILKNGNKFADVASFKHEGLTNLLFKLEGVDIDTGALAMWRIATHGTFGGTWLSDYQTNRLGVDEPLSGPTKPDCPLIGRDGNIFSLIGIAKDTLKENGMRQEANEMGRRVIESHSYDEALEIIGEYVNITSIDDDPKDKFSISCSEGM